MAKKGQKLVEIFLAKFKENSSKIWVSKVPEGKILKTKNVENVIFYHM